MKNNRKNIVTEHPSDECYRTGNYSDDCCCEMCDHRFECSGYEEE